MKITTLIQWARLLILMMCAFCSTACQSYFDATPRVWEDLLLVQDLHDFDLVQSATGPGKWIVAQVNLTPDSNRRIGTTHPDGTMTSTVKVAGTIKVLDPINAAPQSTEWSFEYHNPPTFRAGRKGPRGTWHIPPVTGIMLLRWDATKTDYQMFPDCYRLPDASWGGSRVAEAWRTAAEHPELFNPDNAKANVKVLGEMADRGNPMLTMAAFRTLARGKVIVTSWGDLFIMNGRFPTQGVLMRDYLQNLTEPQVKEVTKRFRWYVSERRTVEEIEGIALAAHVTSAGQFPAGGAVAKDLRNNIGPRLPFMPGDSELREGLIGLSHRWTWN